MISFIVAMDEQNGIGKDNHLLCYLPIDLAYFKAQTMGKTMIMGHKTFQSIGKALPGRRSIVLTTQSITIPGAEVVHSVAEALQLCHNEPEIMVIGGSSVYAQFLPLVYRIYVTHIHHIFDADVYFPPIDPEQWAYKILKYADIDEKNRYAVTFGLYERLKV